MNYPRQFVTGLSSYVEAVRLIFTSQMWLAFIVPIFLSVGLYLGGEVLLDQFQDIDPQTLTEENGSQFLLVGIQALVIYISIFMNKYLVLTLLTPLLAPLSAKTENLLCGNRYPFIIKYYIQDILRAIQIVLRNIFIQMVFMAFVYTFTFFYGLPDIVNQVVYMLIAFYFYGFSFMDYANERRRISLGESVTFTRKNWAAAYALGMVYGGLFFIPYAGVVIAPIFAVVAGTVSVHRIIDLSTNPHAQRPEGEDVHEGEEEIIEVENGGNGEEVVVEVE